MRSSANCSIGHRVRVTDDHCKSVADIAAALGFSDQFSYTHFFKRSTTAPTALERPIGFEFLKNSVVNVALHAAVAEAYNISLKA